MYWMLQLALLVSDQKVHKWTHLLDKWIAYWIGHLVEMDHINLRYLQFHLESQNQHGVNVK